MKYFCACLGIFFYNLTTLTAMESGRAVKIGASESDDCEAETQE
jgi:hypothetical protein